MHFTASVHGMHGVQHQAVDRSLTRASGYMPVCAGSSERALQCVVCPYYRPCAEAPGPAPDLAASVDSCKELGLRCKGGLLAHHQGDLHNVLWICKIINWKDHTIKSTRPRLWSYQGRDSRVQGCMYFLLLSVGTSELICNENSSSEDILNDIDSCKWRDARSPSKAPYCRFFVGAINLYFSHNTTFDWYFVQMNSIKTLDCEQ